jgi:hypothetical protein
MSENTVRTDGNQPTQPAADQPHLHTEPANHAARFWSSALVLLLLTAIVVVIASMRAADRGADLQREKGAPLAPHGEQRPSH